MAIYSLSHSSIGKTTQAQPHTAAAHVDYITRERAASHLEARRMPAGKEGAMAFMTATEGALRKNGRVADKIMLALPRELTAEQRIALVAAFAESVTDGRASWFAAFHDKGKDQANPHCHLVIHDRDAGTGKRVFGMSEKGSTQRLRKLWEEHANTALARASRKERIDRRSLKAQGLERRPTIHVGVRARQLVRDGRSMVSRDRVVRNHCQARTRSRTVSYPPIDGGRLRLEHNVQIRRTNMLASRRANREDEYWKAIDQDAFVRDIRELKRLHAVLEFGPDGVTPMRSRDEGLGRGGLEF
ncbi:MobA/MobL family protein [Ensifer soli]|uniref:MobA/MobL family protein n=1 Tax=Ciceribacter sp. sgz301302 TaxID=3342379 RepID=UPI0035B9C824